jgi:hypothetical protein
MLKKSYFSNSAPFFKLLFNFADGNSFWSKFAEEQKQFQEKYNMLSPAEVFEGLSFEGNLD